MIEDAKVLQFCEVCFWLFSDQDLEAGYCPTCSTPIDNPITGEFSHKDAERLADHYAAEDYEGTEED